MATIEYAGFVYNPETGAGVGGITVTAHLVLGDKTLTAGAAATTTTSSGVDVGYWSFSVVTSTDGAQYAIKYTNPSNGQVRYQRPEGKMQIGTMQGTLVGGVLVAPVPDGSVVTAKLADSSVTSAKIAAGAVTAGKYGAGSIATADIAAGAVTAAKVAADVATQAGLNAHTGDTSDPHGATVTQTNLTVTNLTVSTGLTLPAGSVETADLAAGAVTAAKVAADVATQAGLNSHTGTGHLKVATGTYVGNGTANRDILTPGGTIAQALIFGNDGLALMWFMVSSASGNFTMLTDTSSGIVNASSHLAAVTSGTVLRLQTGGSADFGANKSGVTYRYTVLYT